MMRRALSMALIGGLLFSLSACGETEVANVPPPEEPTRDAIGYYCSMTVVDHPGPKGQIHVKGQAAPHWFSSVRDTIAFTMLPEEAKDIAAIYVNDMGQATNWNRPEAGTWIDAKTAWYVVGSKRTGGMGAPETVPFATKEKAQAFAQENGGHVSAFTEIPKTAILGNPNETKENAMTPMPDSGHGVKHGSHSQ